MIEEGVESFFIISIYGMGLDEFELIWEKKDIFVILDIIVSMRFFGLLVEDKILENSLWWGGYSLIK